MGFGMGLARVKLFASSHGHVLWLQLQLRAHVIVKLTRVQAQKRKKGKKRGGMLQNVTASDPDISSNTGQRKTNNKKRDLSRQLQLRIRRILAGCQVLGGKSCIVWIVYGLLIRACDKAFILVASLQLESISSSPTRNEPRQLHPRERQLAWCCCSGHSVLQII